MFLFKETFFNIHCWYVNIELRANSTITHARTKLIKHTFFFSVRHIKDFLSIGTLNNTSALCFKGILNSKITNKSTKMQKTKNKKKHGIKLISERTVDNMRTETRRQNIAWFSLSWETCALRSSVFHCLLQVCEWVWKHSKYWFGGYKLILVSRWIHKGVICK